MRGWTIVLFVVLIGWVIIFTPPQSLAPYVRPVAHYTDPVFLFAFGLYTLPGKTLLTWIWPGFLYPDLPPILGRRSICAGGDCHLRLGLHALVFILGLAHHPVTLLEADRALESFRLEGLTVIVRISSNCSCASVTGGAERHFGEHATGGSPVSGDTFQRIQAGRRPSRASQADHRGMLRPIGSNEKHFVTIASTGGYKAPVR